MWQFKCYKPLNVFINIHSHLFAILNICFPSRSLPLHPPVCRQTAIRRQNAASSQHCLAVGPKDEEGLDSFRTAAFRAMRSW